jgi:hypothetical protein
MPLAARTDKLLVHDVGDEVIVYDRSNDRAHRLNPTAARVWRALDGRKTVDQLAATLGVEAGLVRLAVTDLAGAHLLAGEVPELSRRRALRKVAAVAAAGVMLPMVSSITAPTPAMAQSATQPPPCDPQDPNCIPV